MSMPMKRPIIQSPETAQFHLINTPSMKVTMLLNSTQPQLGKRMVRAVTARKIPTPINYTAISKVKTRAPVAGEATK